MKVLIIGGTGPTGVFMVEELISKGHDVTVYHTGTHEVEFSRPVAHIHGNPRELECLKKDLEGKKFDGAISTAGRIKFVVEVLKGQVDRFISISGMGVYQGLIAGQSPGKALPMPIPENAPLHNDPTVNKFYHNVYLGEQAVMEGHQNGYFKATVVRYPVIYGPRAVPPLEWYWVKRILDGRRKLVMPGGGTTLVQRGYAQNLAHAVALALEKDNAAGQIYNTGDERSLTIKDIVNIMADALGHQWEQISVPIDLAPQANPYGIFSHTLLDLSKIKSELGYRDIIGVEEASRRTAVWLKENPPGDQSLPQSFDYADEDRMIRSQ
jgi:nucleoside-diphosphate-sugar epimerase